MNAVLETALVLNAREVADLTGKIKHRAQCRMLREMGIPHIPRRGLHPSVMRIHAETQHVLLGGGEPQGPQDGTLRRRPQLQP